MQKKSYFNYIFIGVMIYVIYLLYSKYNELQQISLQNQQFNEIDSSISNYQSLYFKDSEYFDKNIIPEKYYNNWKQLSIVLDKIRSLYGMPVYIIKGYQVPYNNLITDSYNLCRAVTIFGTRDTYQNLKESTQSLLSAGLISVIKVAYKDNDTIEIEI